MKIKQRYFMFIIIIENFEMISRLDKGFQHQSVNQNSNNLYPDPNEMNSISRFHNFMRDQSINFRALSADYSRHIGQEQLDNPEAGNTINFQEANRRNLFVNHGQIKQQKSGLQSEQDLKQQIPQIDHNKKKGLKYLSWILNRLLRKSKFDNNQIVNQCIENVLPKFPQNPNYARQAQNIRRRIYDSINVMSAIGLVVRNGPSQIYIRKSQKNSFCSQRIKAKDELQHAQENGENDQNFKKALKNKLIDIKAKKVYLQKLKVTIKLLKDHLQRNKKINEQEKVVSNSYWIEEKGEDKKIQKVYFPIIIIGTMQEEITIKCYGKNRNKIKIKYEKDQLKVITQLDSLKYIYEQADLKYAQANKTIKNKENHKQIQKWRLTNKQSYEEFVVSCFQNQREPQLIDLQSQEAQNIQEENEENYNNDEFDAKQNIKKEENNNFSLKQDATNKNVFVSSNFMGKNKRAMQKQKKQSAVINIEQDQENSNKFI